MSSSKIKDNIKKSHLKSQRHLHILLIVRTVTQIDAISMAKFNKPTLRSLKRRSLAQLHSKTPYLLLIRQQTTSDPVKYNALHLAVLRTTPALLPLTPVLLPTQQVSSRYA